MKNFSYTKKGPGRRSTRSLPEPGHLPGAKLLRKAIRQQLGKAVIK